MKNVFIWTRACTRRISDSDKIKKYLIKNNYKIVKDPASADIIIFVTCAFIDKLADLMLDTIEEYKQKYNARFIVAGCLPEIEDERLSEIFNGETLSTKDLDKIDELFPDNKIKFREVQDTHVISQYDNETTQPKIIKPLLKIIPFIEKAILKIRLHIVKSLYGEYSILYQELSKKAHLNYQIRIAQGCNGNCSYCAIRRAIGPIKSKPISECIKEMQDGLSKGYNLFIVAADESGEYGLDIGSNLPALLEEMTEIKGDYKITIQSLSPRWLKKYIDKLENIVKKGKIMEIHIPVQSGCNRILKLMNRYFDSDKTLENISRLKNADPQVIINTHIIIGFPTETKEDFMKTMEYIKKVDFDICQIYPYSCKKGTDAEKIEQKISESEISQRIKKAKKYLIKSNYKISYISGSTFFIAQKKNIGKKV